MTDRTAEGVKGGLWILIAFPGPCVKLVAPYLDAAACTIADEISAAPAARV